MITNSQIKALHELSKQDNFQLKKYAESPETTYGIKKEIVDDLFEAGLRGDSALDVGCGIPYMLYCLRECGVSDVLGIDGYQSAIVSAGILGIPTKLIHVKHDMPCIGKFDIVSAFRCNFEPDFSSSTVSIAEKYIPWLLSNVAENGTFVISPNRWTNEVNINKWTDPEFISKYRKVVSVKTGFGDGSGWSMFQLK